MKFSLLALTGIVSCSEDELPTKDKEPKEEQKAILNLDRESIDFGYVTKNSSKDLSINMSNTGTAELKITFLTIKGIGGADFKIVTAAKTIKKGENLDFIVKYSPTTDGAKSASLEIQTNVGTKTINLTGTDGNATINLTNIPLKNYF